MTAALDPHNLQRFVDAQEPVFPRVLVELRQGRKYGHWIWFIFPQMRGLGRSSTSEFFGISSLAEAKAYLKHPLLGPRLIKCSELVNAVEGSAAEDIFGDLDAIKFRSSMTLFAYADPSNQVFSAALEKYFAGQVDSLTTAGLQRKGPFRLSS